MTLKEYASKEGLYAPLVADMRTRTPQRLAVFLKTCALIEGVGEATIVRYCLERWAIEQGYDPNGA